MFTKVATACVALFVSAWAVTSPAAAHDTEPSGPSAEEALAEEMAAHPDALVVGNHVFHADGSVFVALDFDTSSLSLCTNGRFCVWPNNNHQGSIRYWTTTPGLFSVGGTVNSLYNNRAGSARLYNNSGTASTCYAPRARRTTVPVSYQSPQSVYLAIGTTC